MLECWSDWFYLVFECVFPSIRCACWANERSGKENARPEKKLFFSKNWKPFCILLNFFPTILPTTMWRRVGGDAGKCKFPLCDRFWLVKIFVDANESWWSEWNLFFIRNSFLQAAISNTSSQGLHLVVIISFTKKNWEKCIKFIIPLFCVSSDGCRLLCIVVASNQYWMVAQIVFFRFPRLTSCQNRHTRDGVRLRVREGAELKSCL